MKIKNVFFALVALTLSNLSIADGYVKHKDIQWTVVDGKALTLDIYAAKNAKRSKPVVVIYHGGGWLINDNSVMDSMSEYLAEKGGYVVANMNYRLLPENNNTTTMNQIVEDVFGGLLWVKAHIAEYGGDPKRVAITGDSAGGHLTSMIITAGRNLESDGFKGKTLGFKPSWLPKGKTAEEIAKKDGLKVQAAVISYGAFDMLAAAENFESSANPFWQFANAKPRGLFGQGITPKNHPDYYRAVSPAYNIPNVRDYKLPPQFLHVGSLDQTTPADTVKAYAEKLRSAGQSVSLKIYPGNNHGYMDSGCIEIFKSCFDTHAVPVLEDILPFLEQVFSKATSH